MKMKKITSLLLGLSLVLFVFAGCSTTQSNSSTGQEGVQQTKKLSVYTSFYPMYDFALKIGGDKAQITNMVPAGTEPHDWEPTAADITNLEKADVFIYNGAGMEHWAEDILKSLQNKSLVVVEASKGISLMEGHGHSQEEDEHNDEKEHEEEEETHDPHVWLSPANAKQEMENIKNAFVQADAQNKEYYEVNYKKYSDEFDKLDQEFKSALSSLPNKDIVVAHQAFGYLCAAYGLNQVAIEGLTPDSEPDPARMSEVIKFVKENHVKVIFFEELVSPKVAETIAKEANVKTDVLNPIEGLNDEETAAGAEYFSVMRNTLKAIEAALK